MDPITIALLAGLGTSTIGTAGNAFLGTQAQNANARESKRNRIEDTRRFNLGEARNMRNEPYQHALALEQLRNTIFRPDEQDFLTSIASRYANAA